jgi:UDP-glucose 6-dehydrogenase
MRIGFVGLGKLGLPCALASEAAGHDVVGYDLNPAVAGYIRDKKIPYREEGTPELLVNTKIRVVSVEEVVAHSDLIFVAVQTPHNPKFEGVTRIPEERVDFDYTYLIDACKQLNAAIEAQGVDKPVVVISTVLPGTMDSKILPLLGPHFKLCYNPFFIAMGTTVYDFTHPEFVLFGMSDEKTADLAESFYKTIHNAPFYRCSIKSAELIKVAYNTFISTKLAFVNNLMEVCYHTGADVDEVTNALKLAKERLISPKYLNAGMGDGGGCLLPNGIVYGEHGPIQIQDIEPGMRVLSGDGTLRKVLETYKRPYKGPIIRIKARGLPETYVTPEHPFEAVAEGGMPSRMQAQELQVGLHSLIFPKPVGSERHQEDELHTAYMTLAGYYLSEGSLWGASPGEFKRVEFHLHTKEQEFFSEIEDCINKLYPDAHTTRILKEGSQGESLRFNKKEFAMRLYQDFGKGCADKTLPNWVLFGTQADAKAILRGLWRGDGSSNSEGFNFATTSRHLAYGVSLLLRRFDVVNTIQYHPARTGNDEVYHRESWEVRVRNAKYIQQLAELVEMPVRHQMQAKRYDTIPLVNGTTYHPIEKMEVVEYEGTVWNMNVEGTHTYVSEAGINHNCHPRDNIALSWLSRKLGMTYDFHEAIMIAREKQTEFLANLVENYRRVTLYTPDKNSTSHSFKSGDFTVGVVATDVDLPVVILGKAFKEQTNLEVGSPSILLKNILAERGIDAQMYDPWVDNAEDKTVNPYEKGEAKCFFIGTHHAVFANYKFPVGSVVIDPWRMIKDQNGVIVIRVGEATKAV